LLLKQFRAGTVRSQSKEPRDEPRETAAVDFFSGIDILDLTLWTLAANGLPLLSRKEYRWGSFKQYLWSEPGIGLVCSGPKYAPELARRK